MAFQLVYTSAAELLDAGRSGFGTVAKHIEIGTDLQAQLERISQFNREQGLSKERIVFYHRVLDLRGERYHVLSRIKDAGVDYTGRTNHIAHHIILTAAEAASARTASCSPADVILWATSRGFWRDRWEGPSRLFGTADAIPMDSATISVSLQPNGAVTWRQVTGTASNAAILAPGGSATEGCWLLYKEDQSARLLALIGESLCLHADPWAVSFSTDTQPTDRIEELRWRGVHVGSPLEQSARQSVRPVLDLASSSTLPPPVTSACEVAETGQTASAPQEEKIIDRRSVDNRKGASAISAKDSTKGSGRTIGEPVTGNYETVRVSLKDKMKGSGKPGKTKLSPGLWFISVVALVVIILGIFWHACVLNANGDDVRQIIEEAKDISFKLGLPSPSNEQILGLVHDGWISSYAVVGVRKKEELPSAHKLLIEIKNNLEKLNKSISDTVKNINNIDRENLADRQSFLGSELEAKKSRIKYISNISNSSNSIVESIINSIDCYKLEADLSETQKEFDRVSDEIKNNKKSLITLNTNQTFTLKVNGTPVSNGTSISATNGQILHLEGSLATGLPVKISKLSGPGNLNENILTINDQGPLSFNLSNITDGQTSVAQTNIQISISYPTPKVTKIIFFDPSKQDAWEFFFGKMAPSSQHTGWMHFLTNNAGSNLISLYSTPIQWESGLMNCPLDKNSFKQNMSNVGSCFLKKDDANQEVSLTLTVDTNNPITNSLGFQPISIKESGGRYTCSLSTNINSFIAALTTEINSKNYSILYKMTTKPDVSAETLESLTSGLDKKIKGFEEDLSLAKVRYNQEKERRDRMSSNADGNIEKVISPKDKFPDLENAGELLSTGLTFKSQQAGVADGFPENLKKYSTWLKDGKKERSKDTYSEYISAVLSKVKDCDNGLTFHTDEYISATKKIEDILNSKPTTPTEGRKYDNDKAFIHNYNKVFSSEWKKNLAEFVSVVTPRPSATPDLNNLLGAVENCKSNLTIFSQNIQNTPQQILIRNSDGNNVLVLTSGQ